MNALYSLYDALISINVPADRARAVVDAMERDMSSLLATKSDVALLRQEIESTRLIVAKDIQRLDERLCAKIEQGDQRLTSDMERLGQRLTSGMEQLGERLTSDMQQGDQRLVARMDQMEQKIELLRSSMTIRLGSMLIVAMGLLFAALKLTN